MIDDAWLEKDGNILRLRGSFDYIDTEYKRIEIDGETYTNENRVKKTISFDEIRNGNGQGFKIYTYQYTLIGLFDFEVECLHGLSHGVFTERFTTLMYSTDEYVTCFYIAQKYGMLPKFIKGISNGKSQDCGLFSDSLVDIHFHGYGWNNSITIEVSIYDFLKLPTDVRKQIDLNNEIQKSFNKKYHIDTQKEITPAVLLRAFNIYINNKETQNKIYYATS